MHHVIVPHWQTWTSACHYSGLYPSE